MSNQRSLFPADDATAEYARPLAHRHDPVTSRMAALELVESGALNNQCSIVLEALRQHPDTTSDELADRADLDRYMVARRLPDLARQDLVMMIGRRASTLTGRMAVVWRAVLHGRREPSAP